LAEWEYYFKADGTDITLLSSSSGGDYSFSELAVKYLQKIGLKRMETRKAPVDLFKSNPWGLQDLLPRDGTWLLDTVDPKDIVAPPPTKNKNHKSPIVFAVKGVNLPKTDPVFIAPGKDCKRLRRGMMHYPSNIQSGGVGATVRIVLGPDLIAEQAKKK
jgi:hypothetical protein